MEPFKFGDEVRHCDDGPARGLVLCQLAQGYRVGWSDGSVDDHWTKELISVRRAV